jgi:hypothetical protein
MRLGLLVAMLLLVCGTTTACATGLSGAAVGAASPPTPSTPVGVNLLPNGSFAAGTAPWVSNVAANLFVTRTLFPSTALLLRPAAPGSYFSAEAVVPTTPSAGQKYSFEGWMKGSPDLVGKQVLVELGAVMTPGPTTGKLVAMAVKRRPLRLRWRHFSVQGEVPIDGAANVIAIVGVQSVSKYSWLAVDGVAAGLLSPVTKPARPRHGQS